LKVQSFFLSNLETAIHADNEMCYLLHSAEKCNYHHSSPASPGHL